MPARARSQTILIDISGPLSGHDASGLIAGISGILGRHDAVLLDIGEAVVHGSLALGIRIEADSGFATLRAELLECAEQLGLAIRFREAEPDAAADGHFVVTVLGRSVGAEHVARVSSVIAAQGMGIERIERLSGRLSSGGTDETECSTGACVEMVVTGDRRREAEMRAGFLTAAQELSIDIACQRESVFRRNRRLFAFDMDSTLIQGEVIDELAKMAGVADRVVGITAAAMRGEIDFDESFTRRIALLQGLPAERVESLLDAIPLAEGAERLIRTLRLLGYKTAILSGGFTFFARSLQQRLGIDFIYANELEMAEGAVTGRVIPPINNGARKAALLREIAAREGISLEQVVAVGDGANDIPMLSLAGMGIAYRAKPLVREKAGHSISCLGLDALLYLIGVRDGDLAAREAGPAPIQSGQM